MKRRQQRNTLFPYTKLFRTQKEGKKKRVCEKKTKKKAGREAKKKEEKKKRRRSEEHTSVLQSRGHPEFPCPLEKKNST